MFKFAVCDDEILYTDIIEKQIQMYCCSESIVFSVEVFHRGECLLMGLEENKFYDIILLDIEMPGINGMELAKHVRKQLPNAVVMFITSHLEYAVDSFELSIFRYIPKALIKERLPLALGDAINLQLMLENRNYVIQLPKRFEKIPLKNIIYIYKEQKNSVFVMEHEVVKVRKTLETIYEELGSEDFVFIERGYIVNIMHIMKIQENHVFLRDGKDLPISKSHLQDVKNRIGDYWGRHI